MAVNPLADAATSVGDRWTLQVVAALLEGPKRFNELAEEVEGIAPTVLSHRLKHLEREGVVVATPYTTRPPRLSYALSASGQELAGALRLLTRWGTTHNDTELLHQVCGSPLETRWFCPTCDHAVENPSEEEELSFL